jgi:predicted ATPase
MLGGQGPELSRLLPQLRLLFPERPTLLQSSPEQSRRVLFNAVQEFIRRQSSAKPLLLVLEDLHWADDGTLSLLIHLARSISSMKLMIIATHRNDSIDMKPPLTKALEELAHLGVVVQIPLRGLPQPAVAQMIAGLSGTEPPPASVELISSSTDGNPLFVEELVRHLAQDQRNENVFQRLDAGEIALPHSLRLLIGQRLALVSGATALFLRTAAVIGRSFNFSLLEAATRAEPDELVDALEEAEKAGLISSRLEYPEAQFRFRHELIRRAVLDEISLARRQRIHLSVAEAMEQLYSALSHEHSDDLAHHFWSAGAAADPAKTLRYLQMAGEKAVQSSANVKAIGHFREALQLLGTLAGTAERQRKKLLLQSLLGTALIAVEVFSSQEVQKV